MPKKQASIRKHVIEAVSAKPSHLQSIYSFVLRYRPATAQETIRARVYEAVADKAIRRLAPGVYVATRGEATLLLVEGDAREVLRSLDDDSLDAILTDPPYDLGTRKHTATGTTRPHKGKGRTYEQWDLDREILGQMFRVLRKDKQWNTLNKQKRDRGEYPRGGGAMLLFVPPLTRSTWRPVVELIELAESLGFCFYGSFTWDQQILGMGYDAGRNRKNEILFFTAGKRGGVLWDLGLPNVLRHKRLTRRKGEHEAEKPVELFWDLARAVTRSGDVVADFFVGRGRWIQRFLEEGRHVVAVDREAGWIEEIRTDLAQTRAWPDPSETMYPHSTD